MNYPSVYSRPSTTHFHIYHYRDMISTKNNYVKRQSLKYIVTKNHRRSFQHTERHVRVRAFFELHVPRVERRSARLSSLFSAHVCILFSQQPSSHPNSCFPPSLPSRNQTCCTARKDRRGRVSIPKEIYHPWPLTMLERRYS